MTTTVRVPKEILSANNFLYRHWRVYFQYKKNWHWMLRAHLRHVEPVKCKMSVEIISERKNMIDQDNLVGGCKPILDYLKIAGYIQDDGPKFIKLKVGQCRAVGTPATLIIIKPQRGNHAKSKQA